MQNIVCYTPGRKLDWAHGILFFSSPLEVLCNLPEKQRADNKLTNSGIRWGYETKLQKPKR